MNCWVFGKNQQRIRARMIGVRARLSFTTTIESGGQPLQPLKPNIEDSMVLAAWKSCARKKTQPINTAKKVMPMAIGFGIFGRDIFLRKANQAWFTQSRAPCRA